MNCDILLTGAEGQLGWEVARRVQAPLTVRATTRAQLDITNREQVLNAVGGSLPKVVVNAAAYTAVDKAEVNSDTAFSVNRDGPAYLAEACDRYNLPLIHISTDYVFDGRKETPYTEEDPSAPLGVYGESKYAGETVVRKACPQHVILRTAWVYGIHGNNFVKTMLRLGRERSEIRVVDDQRGSPTFAGDLADAVISVARHMIAGTVPADGLGTFHCTGSGVTNWCQFARKIFEIAGPQIEQSPVVQAITTAEYPTPARRPANSALDCSKLARIYGIVPRPWERALRDMLDNVLVADISGESA